MAKPGLVVPAKIRENRKFYPYFKDCIEAIDGNRNDPENEKELFNLRHASLRNVIERIFGIFKSRFTIFKSTPLFPLKTQVEIVLACVALYNFLCKECRSDEFSIEEEFASSSSSIIKEELEELVSQTHRLSTTDYMWTERY
ncbi:hypothetical protein Ddye_016678 [Dipteronia dyeriana]|uniref:DDE Tnp4 domain-containing protein n=1 Tax=Dipteronia dyeriana TaxID=168575 RepID=A0AAD9U847_9ROSI|nr:hypothetical protein Ddye_016678 [Dipteronia dyeriana]